MLFSKVLPKTVITVFTIFVVISLTGCSVNNQKHQQKKIHSYQNPLDVNLADPSIIAYDNYYYLYGTTDYDRGFGCWRSSDLVNWDNLGFAFENDDDMWPQTNMWAPDIVKYKDSFYLLFSASPTNPKGKDFRICIAKSDHPGGPFKLVKSRLGNGLHKPEYGMIDAHVFVDDDGTPYLYYSLCKTNATSEIWVVELTDDLRGTKGEPIQCTEAEQNWENTRIDQDGVGYLWNEAPAVIKHNGTYYMLYSANAYFSKYYGIGYATADKPMGPWEKYEGNPLVSYTDEISGPGHPCFIETFGGELFVGYHRHKSFKGGGDRELAIDRVMFHGVMDAPDILKIMGPTNSPQPMPEN